MVNLIGSNLIPVIGFLSNTLSALNAFPFSPGFPIENVTSLAKSLPSHSWEYGTAAEALLELYNPQYSVFGSAPFPVPSLAPEDVTALEYAQAKIKLGTGYGALSDGDGAAGDPASLGVSAVLLGKTNETYKEAARQTVEGLLQDVPRFANGAISQRVSVAELWADWMYMVPPFLAYYAADQENATLLQQSVTQCGLYRSVLQFNTSESYKGVWMHIIGPENYDSGLWATGNGWAAAGMTRVLATVLKSDFAQNLTWYEPAVASLSQWIMEILDGAKGAPLDNGLLRNYVNDLDESTHGFGEISGSAMLAGVVYRMAVLQPAAVSAEHVAWADGLRAALAGNDTAGNPHITDAGIATPAVNPLWWLDTKPFTAGSPEGQAFVVLMYAAWRDCVLAEKCTHVEEGAGTPGDVADVQGVTVKRRHVGMQRRRRRSASGHHVL